MTTGRSWRCGAPCARPIAFAYSWLVLRDVACFVRVAERGNFSRAAADLGLSQPAISQAIGRLERSLGIRLFERSSRAVRLTGPGRALLPYAEALLAAETALRDEAGRQAVPTIRFAYPPVVGPLVARVARRLAARAPAIDVDLRPAGWSDATAALAAGEVPAAILSYPFPPGRPTTARFQVPLAHLAVPAGGPLAARVSITPADLGRHRMLLPATRPPGSVWARLAAATRQHRVIGPDLDDYAAPLDLVAAGAGVLATPRLVVESVRRPDVRFVPFDAGDLRITYGLAWAPEAASAEVMTLVSTVQEALRTR
jgi:DNA-binding transcriptional LysR family regulator